jgi:hypothetical protein
LDYHLAAMTTNPLQPPAPAPPPPPLQLSHHTYRFSTQIQDWQLQHMAKWGPKIYTPNLNILSPHEHPTNSDQANIFSRTLRKRIHYTHLRFYCVHTQTSLYFPDVASNLCTSWSHGSIPTVPPCHQHQQQQQQQQ